MTTLTKKTKIDVSDLSLAALDIQPVSYDWADHVGDGSWESYEVSECEECGVSLIGRGGEAHKELDSDSNCDGNVPLNEGPMMNYFYALPCFNQDSEEAAKKLKDAALCLVHFYDATDEDQEYALALTGGGMDMTWDICWAFIALGYVPPRHFWRLPKMAGYKLTPERKLVIDAIEKGIEASKAEIDSAEGDLKSIAAYLKANSKKS